MFIKLFISLRQLLTNNYLKCYTLKNKNRKQGEIETQI